MIRLAQISKMSTMLRFNVRYNSSTSNNSSDKPPVDKYADLIQKSEPKVPEFPDMDQFHESHKGAYNKISKQFKEEEENAKTGIPKDYITENRSAKNIKLFENGRPDWAQPELKKINIFKKYLLWNFSKNFQAKYKSFTDVPDYLPMVDREAISRFKREHPEKAKQLSANIKTDMIQKFAMSGMFFELFGYFAMFGSIVVAFVGASKFNNWAEEHIGKSSLTKTEFFREAMSVAWETSSMSDPFKLGGAMYRYKNTINGTYNVDGTLNRELGMKHAEFLFSQEPIVKKYNAGMETFKDRANISKRENVGGWIEDDDLDKLTGFLAKSKKEESR